MKDYRMSLVILFVLKLKGDQRVDGDCLWSCLSFVIGMGVSRQMGSYMKRNGWVWGTMKWAKWFLTPYNIIFLCFV